MPNRIIKESICSSPNFNNLSSQAEVLATRLFTYADDFGRFDARLELIKGRVFPLKKYITLSDIDNWLSELVVNDMINMYIVDDIQYGNFITWEKHQRVRNKRSKIPLPENENENDNDYYLRRFISAEKRRTVLQRDKHKCLCCGSPQSAANPLSIDHIIPVKKGGTNDENNLQTLCMKCNTSKYLSIIDFRKQTKSRRNPQQTAASSGLNPYPYPYPNKPLAQTNGEDVGVEPPAELKGLTLYLTDKKLIKRWSDLYKSWANAFPGVNIIAEVRKAHAWELANPKRIKRDRPRFLNNWLERAQDSQKPNTNLGGAVDPSVLPKPVLQYKKHPDGSGRLVTPDGNIWYADRKPFKKSGFQLKVDKEVLSKLF